MTDSPGLRSATGLRIRFVEDSEGSLSVLEIEIPRKQDVLGEVHQALFEVGVQISNVELQVQGDRIVERLRLVESDGSPVSSDRHLEVQTTVLEVVQSRLVDSVAPAAVSRESAGSAPDVKELSL
jgi:UTP:GlnB (protein PII) uridylyltransferase